jgi:predicted phage tail protein
MEESPTSFGVTDPETAAREYVVNRLKAGATQQAVEQELVQRGYDPAIAADLVRSVGRQHAGSARRSAIGLIAGGIAIAIIGCVLTYLSYNSASPGGRYYVCTGLILLGIYMLIRGIAQLIRGR